MPSMVLPQPGPPQTIVVRPRGKPPPLISSSPLIPVSALGREVRREWPFRAGSSSAIFERFAKDTPSPVASAQDHFGGYAPAPTLLRIPLDRQTLWTIAWI